MTLIRSLFLNLPSSVFKLDLDSVVLRNQGMPVVQNGREHLIK